MCGICGKLQFDDQTVVERDAVERMMQALSHRGPDGRGCHTSGPVGLGHTRLAIIDLHSGAQPMSNEDGTVWVVFNGEIYNFAQLRSELLAQGHIFRTNSDTEVIVHLYEQHGVQGISKLQGMFAYALWDEKKHDLLIVRDRVGIKPLYYSNTGRSLVFASEIKALLADPEVSCHVELQSIDRFLTNLCLSGPDTLWKGINKLEPGFYLLARGGKVTCQRYWDLEFKPSHRWPSLNEAANDVYQLTKNTVKQHMISDVPVGFLLSGGLDSTVVLSCAAEETSQRISTFTVGFDDANFEDERRYAKLAAKRFESDHHEITFTADDFWSFLPSLVRHLEEPLCDPPAVSLHYVSQLARKHVKVLLSGEGGDEAFGGYNIYRKLLKLEKAKSLIGPLASPLSKMISGAGQLLNQPKLATLSRHLGANLPDYHYSRIASAFSYFNTNKWDLYTRDFYETTSREESLKFTRDLFNRVKNEELLNQLLYLDTKTSLPDDLLIKADRITMANSLELRVPFLDHCLLEFAATLPSEYKVHGTLTKRALRQAFTGRIPQEIIDRKKAGFPVPIERWLRTELKEKVRDVLMSQRCINRGYFKQEAVEKLLKLGEQGYPVTKEIFSLLTLELLHLQFVDSNNP